jgi:hypothetical protein
MKNLVIARAALPKAEEVACYARQSSSRAHFSDVVWSERELCATDEINLSLSSEQANRIKQKSLEAISRAGKQRVIQRLDWPLGSH